MALLAELAERDATGETAAIYAEMKRLGGVPMVALIFRHLATLPGALEWMWSAVGPAWRTGHLQEEAWRIARAVPLTPITALRPHVDGAGLREIRTVLEAYNRANPENMLTILCVLRLIGGARAAEPMERRSWTPPAAPGPLPPMADPRTFTPKISNLLDLVAAPGEPGGARVVQSLYRHFVHRPEFLAMAVMAVRQRFDDGSIDRSVADLRIRMGAAADEIVRGLSAPLAPHSGIRPVCERFGGAVIPQMVVVGRLIEDALPD